MLPRTIATVGLVGITVLAVLLTLTTPSSAGPLGLLIVFISAYLAFLAVISFFLFGINRLGIFIGGKFAVKKPLQKMSFRRAYYYGTVLAMAPVMLTGLQSVGSVGLYEVFLVALFEVVACVYISRRLPV